MANLKKLKISTVPDNILPVVLKLFFGRLETVIHLAELIRAVVKTRIFPTKGKLARQILLGRERVKRIVWGCVGLSQWPTRY